MCDSNHFLPPSSSSLEALSSLELPWTSPILDGVDTSSCSSDHIPILFDFVLDDAEADTTDYNQRVSVGTFGPRRPFDSPNTLSSSQRSLSPNNSIHADLSSGSSRSLNLHIPAQESAQDTPPRALVQSQSTLSALSVNTTGSLSPSPSSTHQSSPRLRRKFKFPIDLNFGLSTSKSSTSQVSISESQLAVPALPCERPTLLQHHSTSYNAEQVIVPENLPWLQGMVIELLVDQESFRAVRPTLQLAGFRKHVRGWSHDTPDGGWALFRPMARQSYPFHHAPLDGTGPPILRRLITNDDESRDYISRQATLSLKTTGVYVLHGSESFHPSHSSVKTTAGDGKLRWRFEYFVDNKVDKSGKKLVDGEKLFTPLTFLCSPWLLHRSQGHKMKLMHVVKKSVTTKLVAERLELTVETAGNTTWAIHRRGHSNAEAPKTSKRKAGSIRRTGKGIRDENVMSDHRRAASAEQYVGRHIIPPAELGKMME
ncbi:hypothetical protein C8F01DRAFT_1108272 [Mycena amicta]|nr:hypothetical protein C8F01DRAFT_1108272 [Mycena amicta]